MGEAAMEYDLRQIIILQTMMRALANGEDPTSGIAFPDDTILNHRLLKECFSETAEILEFLYNNLDAINDIKIGKKTNRKMTFVITNEERENIPISTEAIAISKFVYLINDKVHHNDMKKLQATQITKWLCERGYLSVIEPNDGEPYKISTPKGCSIGISTEMKTNVQGIVYATNLYNTNAQKFILENIASICFDR